MVNELTKQEQEEVVQLCLQGILQKEIAAKYNCRLYVVVKIYREYMHQQFMKAYKPVKHISPLEKVFEDHEIQKMLANQPLTVGDVGKDFDWEYLKTLSYV